MNEWLHYSLIAVALWGIVGLLQKLGTNRVSARSLLVWLTVGFLLFLPYLAWREHLFTLRPRDMGLGVLVGIVNGLGSWFLFVSLERGAKASIAIPLTALYPLVTIAFATLFLAETLSTRQWLGIALAVVAGAMLSFENAGEAAAKNATAACQSGDSGRG
ncbi:MAG TPA: DMT family transporter [Bryobacteraceae bacterium]|nr:DMT family transporter [Bryobacteraceae bacterium]